MVATYSSNYFLLSGRASASREQKAQDCIKDVRWNITTKNVCE